VGGMGFAMLILTLVLIGVALWAVTILPWINGMGSRRARRDPEARSIDRRTTPKAA
jgi:hypothetical protein